MLCLLIETAHFIKILLEFFHYWRGRKNLYFVSETAQPTEELIADLNFCGDSKVLFVNLGVDNIFLPEAINGSVQQWIDEAKRNSCFLSAIH